MRTFVMGDIHGAYKAFMQCMERSGFDYEKDRLIQLGDIADGYEEVYECVEELLKIRNLVAIKGNHDDWFNEFIRTGYHPRHWTNGAEATLRSYGKQTGQLTGRRIYKKSARRDYRKELRPELIPETHRRFFDSQRLYYIDRARNCFVHGGFNRHVPFKGQSPENYYWDRDLWSEALTFELYTKIFGLKEEKFDMVTSFHAIFIGHTPTLNWDMDWPMKAANIYNVDTGTGHGGRLTIMDVDSKKFWQSVPVAELYTRNYR